MLKYFIIYENHYFGMFATNHQLIGISSTSASFEKAMATHSSTLAWKIPGMEEPGGLQSMG